MALQESQNSARHMLQLTFFRTGNGDVREHYDPVSSHGQVAVVTAFLCQFNQVSEPGGNCRPTWENYLRGIQIGHETNGASGNQPLELKFKTQRHSDWDGARVRSKHNLS